MDLDPASKASSDRESELAAVPGTIRSLWTTVHHPAGLDHVTDDVGRLAELVDQVLPAVTTERSTHHWGEQVVPGGSE